MEKNEFRVCAQRPTWKPLLAIELYQGKSAIHFQQGRWNVTVNVFAFLFPLTAVVFSLTKLRVQGIVMGFSSMQAAECRGWHKLHTFVSASWGSWHCTREVLSPQIWHFLPPSVSTPIWFLCPNTFCNHKEENRYKASDQEKGRWNCLLWQLHLFLLVSSTHRNTKWVALSKSKTWKREFRSSWDCFQITLLAKLKS